MPKMDSAITSYKLNIGQDLTYSKQSMTLETARSVHSDYVVWKDTSEQVTRRCDDTVDKIHKTRVNFCVLKHRFGGSWVTKKSPPKAPTNAVSDACHGTLQGRGRLKSHGLSETPIVWRNTSVTFTPRGLGCKPFLVRLSTVFWVEEVWWWTASFLSPLTTRLLTTLCSSQYI